MEDDINNNPIDEDGIEEWLDNQIKLESLFPRDLMDKTTLVGVPVQDIDPKYLSQILASCVIQFSTFSITSNDILKELQSQVEELELSEIKHKAIIENIASDIYIQSKRITKLSALNIISIILSVVAMIISLT